MTVKILVGDVRARLSEIPDGSIHCCITSPPYFGLRSYGTDPQVWGGDPECEHQWVHDRRYVVGGGTAGSSAEAFSSAGPDNAARIKAARWREDDTCSLCGAWRGELGAEPTLSAYIATLVGVFREVRRVLRDDGTVWLNLGDSYASTGGVHTSGSYDGNVGRHMNGVKRERPGFKPKDLMMVPARVAIALQEDGWWIRSDIIWNKSNPIPESCRDRPTSAHEHVFLLSKRPTYYFDQEAIREEGTEYVAKLKGRVRNLGGRTDGYTSPQGSLPTPEGGRNRRNVWTVSTTPFPGSHFATFPAKLIEPMILAGTSEKGCCGECGAPWVRVVERMPSVSRQTGNGWQEGRETAQHHGPSRPGSFSDGTALTTGWFPSCACGADPVPCTILDPFGGAGTVGVEADRLGRDAVLIELNPEYAKMSEARIRGKAPMFARVDVG